MASRNWLLLPVLLAACGGPSAPSPVVPLAATPAPSPVAVPSPDPTVRSASLTGASGHSASGTARIVARNGGFVLELGDDFRLDGGKTDVYLAGDRGTVRASDLNLGALGSRTGAQTFAMPDDGGRYPYVLLWCRPAKLVIGVGELR